MLKKLSFCLLILFLTLGCTFRKLAYRWADAYFLLQIDNAFELDVQQKKVASHQIKQWLDWHRVQELPRYEQFVAQIAERAKRPLSHEDTDWAYTEIIKFGDTLAKKIAPESTAFILSLRNTQFDKLVENNKKRNQKRFEKYFAGEKRFVRMRTRDVQGHTRDWLGSVTDKQNALIAAYAVKAWDFEKLRYENALNNQRDFLATLHTHDAPKIQRRFAQTFAFLQTYQTPEYRVAYQENRNQIAQLLLDLQHAATSQQLQFLQKKLRDLRADLKDMQKTPFL